MAPTGMSSHQSARSETVEWLTPPEIIRALGPFDLDPCSPADRPWPTARDHISLPADGLQAEWWGRVWLNPPYSATEQWEWVHKLADHGNGMALIFARTETKGFHRAVWDRAHALFFFEGRLNFHDPIGRRSDKNAGAPSVLVAYG